MSTSNHSDSQSIAPELPPVLAKLPWLDRGVVEPPPPVEAVEAQPLFDSSFFEPHQLLATADQPLVSPSPAPKVVRFDPPQTLQTTPPAHTPSPAAASDSDQFETTAPAERTVVRSTEPRGADGITQLRFDPPVSNRAEPTPAAALELDHEPSSWHQTIAALDNGIRQYHRVIMLAALLTAAGLMMLVLESQQTKSNPASETVTPAAIDIEAMQPMNMAEVCTPPAAVPERIAMARGPQGVSRELPIDAPLPPTEAAADPELAPAKPEISILPEILPEIEAPEQQSTADGEYMSTGMPAFQLDAPHQSDAPPVRARLSKDLKPGSQQTR